MSRLVQVKAGQSNVDLNRQLYTQNDKVLLSDKEYANDTPGLTAVITDLGPGMLLSGVVSLSSITTNGQTVATITPGFAGKLEQVFAIVNTVASTAAKVANIGVFIDPDGAGSAAASRVSGGDIQLLTAGVTPVNKIIPGTLIRDTGTTPVRFSSAAVITFVTTALPTAFVEGAVTFVAMFESSASFKPGPIRY